MLRYKNKFVTLLFLLSLTSVFLHYAAGDSTLQRNLFNSDALYLPTLFSDILKNNGSIKDWYLTPAPYIFPDFFIFFVSYLISPSPYIQIIVFAILQIVLTFGVIWLLAWKTSIATPAFVAATTSIVVLGLALICGEPFVLIINSAHHYGIFLSALILVAFKTLAKTDVAEKTPWHFVLILGLILISTLSDSLFLVQAVIPFVATTVFMAIITRRFSVKDGVRLLLIGLAAIGGWFFYRLLIAHHTRFSVVVGFEKVYENIIEIKTMVLALPVNGFVLVLISVFYGLVIAYSALKLIGGSDFKNTNAEQSLLWIVIFSFFSICTTLGVFLLTTNLLILARYSIPVFLWPVVIVLLFVSKYFKKFYLLVMSASCFFIVASLVFNSYRLIERNGLRFNYYPAEISCIDHVLGAEAVTHGIAQYWDAKRIQNFSKFDLSLAQYYDDLSEMHWITSGKYFRPWYDFAIISENAAPQYKISKDRLFRLNGVAKRMETCGDISIYVYGKNAMRVK